MSDSVIPPIVPAEPASPAGNDARASAAPRTTGRTPPDTSPPLFEEGHVTITRTRIVTYGVPAPLNGLRAVRLHVDRPHVRFAIPILLIGLALGIYGIVVRQSPIIALGFMLLVVSFLTYRFQNLQHRLFVIRVTPDKSGKQDTEQESEVFANGDLPYVERVQAALQKLIDEAPNAPGGSSDSAPGNAAAHA